MTDRHAPRAPAPKHLSPSPPVPTPRRADDADRQGETADRRDPTRYGDWELNGIAVDF